MHVLIFSPFFHPEAISTGRYNTVLAQELVAAGASVEVFASHPLYPGWRPVRSADQVTGVQIHRGGAWMRYPMQQTVRRVLLECWYSVFVAWSLLIRRPQADRIVLVFPPMLLAFVVRRMFSSGVPIIGIVHDLQGVMARSAWVRRLARWLEKRAFGVCDRLVFLSQSMQSRAHADYQLETVRSAVHYPFLTLSDCRATGNELAGLMPEGLTHVVYSGALGEKQEPDRLLSLMCALAGRGTGLRCHIFSAGPHFERLRAVASSMNSEVAFHPLVQERQLGELYSRSALQIIPQASGTGDGAIPSKLPNLIAAGVPVFMICDADSEAAFLLEQAGNAAGCRVDAYEGPETVARFDAFLAQVQVQAREERIRCLQPFVERAFGTSGIVDYILIRDGPT